MDALEYLKQIAAIFGYVSAIVTAAVLLIKPLRDKVLGFKYIVSGMKCLLRADMLRIYYKHHDRNEIRQHERENLEAEYRAYKALGGNSFIDGIYQEVTKWEVVS